MGCCNLCEAYLFLAFLLYTLKVLTAGRGTLGLMELVLFSEDTLDAAIKLLLKNCYTTKVSFTFQALPPAL